MPGELLPRQSHGLGPSDNNKHSFIMIHFHDVNVRDREFIQRYTLPGTSQNCDLSFANIISWRFLYDTQYAIVDDYLVFRFYTGHHLAYMPPIPKPVMQADGNYGLPTADNSAGVIMKLRDDSIAMGHPFLLIGVGQEMAGELERSLPGMFNIKPERDFFDYIYLREKLISLSGKHLQSKRNHCNKFRTLYPDYEYRPLTKSLIPECLRLEEEWRQDTKGDATSEQDTELSEELRSMTRAFTLWDYLGCTGGTLFVKGRMVAFTFGCPINHNTFDVCIEKANINYEGAFAIINQEFVRHLPEEYTYINREEDLGQEGLRKAKLSYKPEVLLEKYSIMEKQPLREFEHPERIKTETEELYRATFHDSEAFTQLYFDRCYRPERNIVCQIGGHVAAALQALPYRLGSGSIEALSAYIYAVSVEESYRRQHVGSSLMQQAHHTLYSQGYIFAVLIPAEPWLFDWYAGMGYTQIIRSIAPPAGAEEMDFAAFDDWQRSQGCFLRQNEQSFLTAREDLRTEGPSAPAPGMLRVINGKKALELYAQRHPDFEGNLRVYNDKDIAANNIYFRIAAGRVERTDRPLPEARALTINELSVFILHDEKPTMTLMMN